jgi:hypothetical protein
MGEVFLGKGGAREVRGDAGLGERVERNRGRARRGRDCYLEDFEVGAAKEAQDWVRHGW